MTDRLRIVVSGYLAQYPLGGVAWDYLQYPVGLSRLGHDVYYLEDTGQWPYNPTSSGLTDDCRFNVTHLRDVMQRFGLGERWAYRNAHEERWYGLADERREEIVATADLVLNVSGALQRPWDYRPRGRLVYLDTDPVFTQVKLARGQADFARAVDAHDVHFSFGESPSAAVPVTGHAWQPTRQPVLLDEWTCRPTHRDVYTTVMSWNSYNPVEHAGTWYGQKDVELMRFLELPERIAPVRLELALAFGRARRPPLELLRHRGWLVADPAEVCGDIDGYRDYVLASKGEWAVAKNGYVVGQPGWFSCRSACYLAAGRPVVVQDTGFGRVLPTGRGLLAFTDVDEAAAALEEVQGNYEQHALAAVEIAREAFDARVVLGDLLDVALATAPGSKA